ncbi:sodium:solute symporter [Zhihengliuella halotolerans]|uniref:SSS family solute:Na+ symporter n=1 Tax=Zhihengliuella halotolerans TaxID=370736 RepID=A0A4V2G9K0_9MICC|nr:sodium:solute symporter [Zhihengliuella halotolerans]RZU60626.1 SSS family solute:Na+ symporter [Zhihengliuella halotolerans]
MDIINSGIVGLYLVAMLLFGWWGKSRTRSTSDYLVAGRRLGPFVYTGTMAALVLGGASTVGGVGLGYQYGISGAWLVIAIGTGVLLLSLLFAPRLQRLKIYTVSQMLSLRYGSRQATQTSSVVMLAYTLMLCATSTSAYATVFVVLFDWEKWLGIAIGGGVVVLYSTIGGMWSITLADQVQFVIKTIGVFALMLPFTLGAAGGIDGARERLTAEFFQWDGIGTQTIITYFVVYTLGLLIGQDIWQRVFTARTPAIARWGGASAGIYCILYGVAGAAIGLAARAALPDLDTSAGNDVVFASVATEVLPAVVGGIVMAAAVAAMMSTASGALIAAATVARNDVTPLVAGWFGRGRRPEGAEVDEHDITGNRYWVLALGVVTVVLAIIVDDVVAALTISYDILVGGLLIPIIGGLTFRRGNGIGAAASMAAGTIVTIATIIILEIRSEERFGGVYANEPIYFGLAASAAVYLVVSLLTRPTSAEVMTAWTERLAGRGVPEDEADETAGSGATNR